MSPSDSVENRIATVLDSLSQKQTRLARFVLDSKYFMSFASASQAGEKTRTSAATVVRFAQTLGYQGYSELQAAIRAELPSYLTAAERIQANADREREVILAGAYRDAERIRGEGDALATEIYAASFGNNEEFYGLYRSLNAYRQSFSSGKDIMLLQPDSEFFKYFNTSEGGK